MDEEPIFKNEEEERKVESGLIPITERQLRWAVEVDSSKFSVENVDVSQITNFDELLYGAMDFNQNISKWRPLSATSMDSMFFDADDYIEEHSLPEWYLNHLRNKLPKYEELSLCVSGSGYSDEGVDERFYIEIFDHNLMSFCDVEDAIFYAKRLSKRHSLPIEVRNLYIKPKKE